VDGVIAQTQITILDANASLAGVSLWSAPTLGGLAQKQVVQAAPSGSGPDLYSIGGDAAQTAVQALGLDGRQLWQTWLPATNGNSAPDAYGGLIVTQFNTCDNVHPMRIVDLDGVTGDWRWQVESSSTCTGDAPQFALRRDGSVVVVSPGNTSGLPELMILDGLTGQQVLTPSIPPSSYTLSNGAVINGYSRIGPPMVGPDGSTYVAFEQRHLAFPVEVTSAAIWLMKIDVNGTITTTQLTSTNTNTNLFPGRIIPDGQGGVVATWTYSPVTGPMDPNPLRAAHVTSGGGVTQFFLPIQPPALLLEANGVPVNPAMALGESATAFVTYGPWLASFDPTSGNTNWSYASAGAAVSIAAADSTNGVAVTTTAADGTDTVVHFNSSGGVVESLLPSLGRSAMPIIGDFWAVQGGFDFGLASNPWWDLARTWYEWNQRRTNQAVQQHKIVVKCRAIKNDPSDAWYLRAAYQTAMHCYIVVKDAANVVQTIEGAESMGRPSGTLIVGAFAGDSKQPNRPTDPQYFATDDANSDTTIACLLTKAAQLNQAAVPYYFLGPNSNRTVFELMNACNRTVNVLYRGVGWWVPVAPWH
jgi:hypothetical protein